ncbi:lipopolysaccharide biosynthesis protein [Asaia sp. HN128]|uniref:lipopolysaccharide biosynthesis protein n=1 Tax=Asaia sp. HN128 TaxID=3081234 RepID=UPI0030193618
MPKHPTAAKRIIHNVSFLTLGRIATAICSFAYIAFAVRALGLAQFGLLILIHSLGIMASTFSRMQSWQTFIRYGNEPYARRDLALLRQILGFCIRLDMLSAVVAIAIGVISVAFYSHVAHWTPWVTTLAYGYALICPFMYTGWSNGVLRLTDRFHLVPISDTCTAIFRTAGTALGFVLHLKLGFFVLVWAGAVLMDYGLFLYFALTTLHQKIGLRLHPRDVFGQWRWQLPGMWAFTRSTSINQTLGAVSGHISTLVVGSLLGSAEAAVFRICRQIADGIVTPAQMLSPVLYPELVKMRDRQDWSGLKRITWKIFFMLCAVSVALLLVAAFFGGRIFSLMLHIHLHGTTYYISIMLVSAVLTLLVVPLEPLLTVMGQIGYLMANRTWITLAYFPVLYGLTSVWSLKGACYATVFSSLAMFITRLWRAIICSLRPTQHAGVIGGGGVAKDTAREASSVSPPDTAPDRILKQPVDEEVPIKALT